MSLYHMCFLLFSTNEHLQPLGSHKQRVYRKNILDIQTPESLMHFTRTVQHHIAAKRDCVASSGTPNCEQGAGAD